MCFCGFYEQGNVIFYLIFHRSQNRWLNLYTIGSGGNLKSCNAWLSGVIAITTGTAREWEASKDQKLKKGRCANFQGWIFFSYLCIQCLKCSIQLSRVLDDFEILLGTLDDSNIIEDNCYIIYMNEGTLSAEANYRPRSCIRLCFKSLIKKIIESLQITNTELKNHLCVAAICKQDIFKNTLRNLLIKSCHLQPP